MKKIVLFFILIQIGAFATYGQVYSGPIPAPTSGYGSEGTNSVDVISYPNPNFPTENIRVYYPAGITSSVPTIFYAHGFGGYEPINVLGLLQFVAKKGYAIVFVPYQTNGVTHFQRYSNLLNGFIQTARDYPNIIDTTRVGFMGHSFGGGSTFANAYHCFTQLDWGSSGRFIFASAQWYSFNISQAELQSYPNDVKMLTVVYENDVTNDHRMANDIFNNIGIPSSEKDYLLVKSDTISNYIYEANHGVPNTASSFDALDYYALYRHLDALCDYTFNGNLTGKDVALGNGSLNQVVMPGGLHNLVQSDAPTFAYPQSMYNYPCSTASNPREIYCDGILSTEETEKTALTQIFPNPATSVAFFSTDKDIQNIEIFNATGQKQMEAQGPTASIQNLSTGLYFAKVTFQNETFEMLKLWKQ